MPDNPRPTLNAALHLIALVFLLLGRRAVKRGDVTRHWQFMSLALANSALFLGSYLYYHYQVGSVAYVGAGWVKGLYLLILIPHIVLATLQVPFILAAVWTALRHHFSWHVKIVRWVWPVWVYVSITGVLVYLMLYIFPHG
jgi:putative membrane protein